MAPGKTDGQRYNKEPHVSSSGSSLHRQGFESSGVYYKPNTIANDDSSIINKLETSLIDAARVVIYDRHMFIVQVTGATTGTRNEQMLKKSFIRNISAHSSVESVHPKKWT